MPEIYVHLKLADLSLPYPLSNTKKASTSTIEQSRPTSRSSCMVVNDGPSRSGFTLLLLMSLLILLSMLFKRPPPIPNRAKNSPSRLLSLSLSNGLFGCISLSGPSSMTSASFRLGSIDGFLMSSLSLSDGGQSIFLVRPLLIDLLPFEQPQMVRISSTVYISNVHQGLGKEV